ncbi:hypothetical protein [uncultured Aquimarina sp.]|uniref:hypothetical protein n=1 Tax=uncultured Aquimarina sp. TaxID=575652 RepID=UPI002639204B|nr:hypothetical protein [uncultured Aquimarina sp.]
MKKSKVLKYIGLIGSLASIIGLLVYFLPLTKPEDKINQLTVLVHGEKGKDDLILTNRGKVKLIYGDANVEEVINSKGEATFKQIPEIFFHKKSRVEIIFLDPKGEPYKSLNTDSLYKINRGEYVSLPIKLYGLNQIKGIVKDFQTGNPVSNVRISILGTETYSNKFGEYLLNIPIELQQKFQTVRAYKKGYNLFELNDVPIQTNIEFPISLKPKKTKF